MYMVHEHMYTVHYIYISTVVKDSSGCMLTVDEDSLQSTSEWVLGIKGCIF